MARNHILQIMFSINMETLENLGKVIKHLLLKGVGLAQ